MIVLPNKNKVNTDDIIDLVKVILKESQSQVEFTNAKCWGTDEINTPDIITIDINGDYHIVHLFVADGSVGDIDGLEDIAKRAIKKKTCKKEATKFNKEFDDEIPGDAFIYVDVMFLVMMEGIEFGKIYGVNRYGKKACELPTE